MEISKENDLQVISKGQWQWLPNKHSSLCQEPEWEFFSLAHNYLIEKAYYDKQKEVSIDGSIISFKQMLLKKKKNKVSQLPIRRISWPEDEEDTDRCERYFDTGLPQPAGQISRSLADVLSSQTPEFSQFMALLESVEKSQDMNGLNHQVVPQLNESLQKELNKERFTWMTTKLRPLKKRMQYQDKEHNEKVIMSLRKEFLSFEEFYGQILQTYTMNTLLYRNLNKYLKTENWLEIKYLLPYAFCLYKAFFNQKLNASAPTQETGSLILYRGTSLDESGLSSDDLKTGKYFHWNSIISTTKNKEIAESFMYKSVDLRNNKYPVMFIIEIPSSANSLKWMDVHQYSVMPSEDEVLLSPGTVCIIEEASTSRSKITTIRMKLKDDDKDFEKNQLFESEIMMIHKEEFKMPSDFHEEVGAPELFIEPSHMIQIKGIEAKVICLEGEELLQALEFISRDSGIETLEFYFCTFDSKSLQKTLEILPKMKRTKIFRFISCHLHSSTEVENIIPKRTESLNLLQIEIIDTSNFHKILCLDHTSWQFLKSIDIRFETSGKINDDGLHDFCSQSLKYFAQLESLVLDFSHCFEISDQGVVSLSNHGLSHLTQLTSLKLIFVKCFQITRKGVESLAQGLNHLTQLASLEINFRGCDKVGKEEVTYLCSQGLKHLGRLRSLNLHVKDFQRADGRIKGLELENFTQLTSLALSCSLKDFFPQELKFLFQLKSLDLFFDLDGNQKERKQETNEKLKILSSEALQYLPQLTSLRLRFKEHKRKNYWEKPSPRITDPGLNKLASFGLKFLTQLTFLDLEFNGCVGITDQGLMHLFSQGLKYLAKLMSLRLSFKKCQEITGSVMPHLCSEVLQNLPRLSSLDLTFSSERITDDEIKTLAVEGLCHLTELKSLSLDLSDCNLTYEGIESLCSQALSQLAQLTDLKLDIICVGHNKIVPHIFSQTVAHLTQLTSLILNGENLSFSLNGSVTKKPPSLHQIAFQRAPFVAIKELFNIYLNHYETKVMVNSRSNQYLTQPEIWLYREFLQNKGQLLHEEEGDPNSISLLLEDLGILSHFSKLPSLSLDFDSQDKHTLSLDSQELISYPHLTLKCKSTTDNLIMELCSAFLPYLSHLVSLNLDFSTWCFIEDKGLKCLGADGLLHLEQLESLSINFRGCRRFSYRGVSFLCYQGLRHLTQLKSLELNFSKCKFPISDRERNLYSLVLKYLPDLTSLNLNFSSFQSVNKYKILDCQDNQCRLTSLTSLTLDFSSCEIPQIDEGVHNLCHHGIQHLTQLTHLDLNFEGSQFLTEQGLQSLSDTIQNLIQLKYLRLNFNGSERIQTVGFVNLCSQGLKPLSNLQFLNLHFSNQLTEKNTKEMFSQGLKHLTQLVSLTLNIPCQSRGLHHVASEGLKYFTQLTSLDLCFPQCPGISNQIIKNFCSEGLRHLFQLTSLRLAFDGCKALQDEAINALCSQGLRNLPQLKSLRLGLIGCGITSEGLNFLCSTVLKYLTQLTVLKIDSDTIDSASKQVFTVLHQFGFVALKDG